MNICSENATDAPRFLVLGFQIQPELKFFLFLLFLSIYLVTVVGNTFILTTVAANNTLHSPMYFLLGNLSSLEICFTTNTAPTMLGGFLSSTIAVSLSGCVVQLHTLGWLTCTECVLLTLMAYDRYLAICYPLHYGSLMSDTVCLKLVLCIWTSGFLAAMIISILIYQLEFPPQPQVDHFICDFVPLLKAACSDVSLPEMFRLVASFTVTLIPCFLIITSYVCVISTILKIPLATGRQKAFSTCSSHLLVVAMYFGTLIALYVAPSTGNSLTLNKALSLLYTVATPLFNPIIYTLRNKEIREGLRHPFRTIYRQQGDGGGKLNKRKT